MPVLIGHEPLPRFASIGQNWSLEDLLLTSTDWQFRGRPGAHRELGCRQIVPTICRHDHCYNYCSRKITGAFSKTIDFTHDEPWLGLLQATLNTLARDDYFDYCQRTGAKVQ